MRREQEERYFTRLALLALLILTILTLGGFAEFQQRGLELPVFRELGLRRTIIWFFQLIVVLLPSILLNSLPAFLALAVIPWLASRFIRTLYDAKDLSEAHGFLHRNVFGSMVLKPKLIIKEGEIAVGKGSFCDRVGGWAFVIIHNNNAVVMEKGGRLTRVEGPGLAFLEPFERVWDVIDLRPQRWTINVSAMTKDGIPVEWEAEVTFKIDDRYLDEAKREKIKRPVEIKPHTSLERAIAKALEESGIRTPLPHTEEAVFNAATSAWIRIRQPYHAEQLRTWMGRVVIGEVEGTLRTIIANYRLDWLIQPPRPEHAHPRDEIGELLKHQVQSAFPVGNKVGARVIDIALGQFNVKDESIPEQWINAWEASWEQQAITSMAEGEAELARLNAAEVQAKAEMVLTLTEAIRPLVASEEELSSYALATRFVETLWWMSYAPWRRSFLPPDAIMMLDSLDRTLKGEMPPDQIPFGDRGSLRRREEGEQ